jgi:hypothetical protein
MRLTARSLSGLGFHGGEYVVARWCLRGHAPANLGGSGLGFRGGDPDPEGRASGPGVASTQAARGDPVGARGVGDEDTTHRVLTLSIPKKPIRRMNKACNGPLMARPMKLNLVCTARTRRE